MLTDWFKISGATLFLGMGRYLNEEFDGQGLKSGDLVFKSRFAH